MTSSIYKKVTLRSIPVKLVTFDALKHLVHELEGDDLDTLGDILGVSRYAVGSVYRNDDAWMRYRIIGHVGFRED